MHAMKLETEIVSPVKGKVTKINVSPDEQVSSDQILVEVIGREELAQAEEDDEEDNY